MIEVPKDCPLCSYSALSQEPTDRTIHRFLCRSCGRYAVTFSALPEFLEVPQESRIRLAWLVREASDHGQTIEFNTTNIEAQLAEAPRRSSAIDSLERIVISIQGRSPSAERWVALPGYEFPAFRCYTPDELFYLSKMLYDMGLIELREVSHEARLTPKGWERVRELVTTERRSNQAFVAMWFDPEMDPVYNEGLAPGLRDAGYDPFRVDRAPHNNKIDDEIIAGIRRSGLLVADFTRQRQGVYYEAGFAVGLGIPVIRTCRKSEIDDVHFDTRQYSHILWETPEGLRKSLRDHIEATVPFVR